MTKFNKQELVSNYPNWFDILWMRSPGVNLRGFLLMRCFVIRLVARV